MRSRALVIFFCVVLSMVSLLPASSSAADLEDYDDDEQEFFKRHVESRKKPLVHQQQQGKSESKSNVDRTVLLQQFHVPVPDSNTDNPSTNNDTGAVVVDLAQYDTIIFVTLLVTAVTFGAYVMFNEYFELRSRRNNERIDVVKPELQMIREEVDRLRETFTKNGRLDLDKTEALLKQTRAAFRDGNGGADEDAGREGAVHLVNMVLSILNVAATSELMQQKKKTGGYNKDRLIILQQLTTDEDLKAQIESIIQQRDSETRVLRDIRNAVATDSITDLQQAVHAARAGNCLHLKEVEEALENLKEKLKAQHTETIMSKKAGIFKSVLWHHPQRQQQQQLTGGTAGLQDIAGADDLKEVDEWVREETTHTAENSLVEVDATPLASADSNNGGLLGSQGWMLQKIADYFIAISGNTMSRADATAQAYAVLRDLKNSFERQREREEDKLHSEQLQLRDHSNQAARDKMNAANQLQIFERKLATDEKRFEQERADRQRQADKVIKLELQRRQSLIEEKINSLCDQRFEEEQSFVMSLIKIEVLLALAIIILKLWDDTMARQHCAERDDETAWYESPLSYMIRWSDEILTGIFCGALNIFQALLKWCMVLGTTIVYLFIARFSPEAGLGTCTTIVLWFYRTPLYTVREQWYLTVPPILIKVIILYVIRSTIEDRKAHYMTLLETGKLDKVPVGLFDWSNLPWLRPLVISLLFPLTSLCISVVCVGLIQFHV